MKYTCLELRKVSKHFNGLRAVNQVSFSVGNGQIVSIIGPNGAGKTSIFNLITGVYASSGGEVLFNGSPMAGKRPHEVASLGISRTFQSGGLFREITVLENVMLGLHGTVTSGFFSSMAGLPSVKKKEKEIAQKSLKALRRMNLENKKGVLAASLSYGDQRLVELARATISSPSLLLLDEPGAGLNETEKESLIQIIQELKGDGMTILLVEHHMETVIRISDKVVVLNFGEKIAEGPPEEIIRNTKVIAAYLGIDSNYAGDS